MQVSPLASSMAHGALQHRLLAVTLSECPISVYHQLVRLRGAVLSASIRKVLESVARAMYSVHDRPSSVTKGMSISPPPSDEALCRDVDPQILERLGTQMAIVRTLNTSVGVVAFGIGLNTLGRDAHDFGKSLTHFVLGVLVFA